MRRRTLCRVAAVANRLDPAPDPRYLAYARAVIAFGGQPESEGSAVRFARWLGTGGWRSRIDEASGHSIKASGL
jgi:hypothetical protein